MENIKILGIYVESYFGSFNKPLYLHNLLHDERQSDNRASFPLIVFLSTCCFIQYSANLHEFLVTLSLNT